MKKEEKIKRGTLIDIKGRIFLVLSIIENPKIWDVNCYTLILMNSAGNIYEYDTFTEYLQQLDFNNNTAARVAIKEKELLNKIIDNILLIYK